MTKRAGAALFAATALLFFLANRAAYKGYFQDDELDNISWVGDVSPGEFLGNLLTPKFLGNNFRPVGHLYFRLLGKQFGLDFPKYVLVLHALHLVNVWLLWRLARRLGIGPLSASLGTLFFAFHMAAFDAYWKPMYVFDVLCATFCLGSFLLYTYGRYVLSFGSFWLAYKSKELAIMLPAVLACYELWLGRRRWKPLVPFFAVSLSFGLQGIFLNPHADDDYTLHFTPLAVGKTVDFYSSKILLVPKLGLTLFALPLLTRDRRLWFGLASLALWFVPLLVLPGRLYAAYCYLPITGLALAAAALSAMDRIGLVAICCLLWIPWNMVQLRRNRRQALAIADENRAYVSALSRFARSSPDTHTFIYDGLPTAMHPWGVTGALRVICHRADVDLHASDEPDVSRVLGAPDVALLNWDPLQRRLAIVERHPDTPDAPYIRMDRQTPVWQLGTGWYRLENRFRWIQRKAVARLSRPASAKEFELYVNIGPDLIKEIGHTEVTVLLDKAPLGRHTFTTSGWQTVRWPVPESTLHSATVEFRVEPEYHPANGDPRPLGVAVAGFGFVPGEAH